MTDTYAENEKRKAIDVEVAQVSDKVTHLYTWLVRYDTGTSSFLGSFATEQEAQQHRPTRYATSTLTLIRVRLP